MKGNYCHQKITTYFNINNTIPPGTIIIVILRLIININLKQEENNLKKTRSNITVFNILVSITVILYKNFQILYISNSF